MLRALPLIDRLERPLFMQAGDLLRQAIALEPEYAAAHAWYAYWHVLPGRPGLGGGPGAGMARPGGWPSARSCSTRRTPRR